MREALERLAETLGGRARRDEPLAPHTSVRVGGPADLLVTCYTTEEMVEVVRLARAHSVPWWVLGGGCNVLVADAGVRGLVIINHADRVRIEEDGTAWAEAGTLMAILSRKTVARELAGLEWAAGLPGTVGGAVVGNAGAFGGDVASVLRSAAVLGPDGRVVERPAEWFEFEYRRSRIKRRGSCLPSFPLIGDAPLSSSPIGDAPPPSSPIGDAPPPSSPIGDAPPSSPIGGLPPSFPPIGGEEGGGYVVLAVTFGLQPGDPEALAVRTAEVLEWRRTRHPSGATMGSTFKNAPDTHAGRLIEEVGLKGHRIGGVKVSEQHANFLINTGGAAASDVLALIRHVQTEVEQRRGVLLELEIELVGEWRENDK